MAFNVPFCSGAFYVVDDEVLGGAFLSGKFEA
jgi:hypothetical protein